MDKFIKNFLSEMLSALNDLPKKEIKKAASILLTAHKNGNRLYVFGNGGSWAMASHWVSHFNKTIFSTLPANNKIARFQAIRIPSTHEELTAWANDVGYDMVFAGPLANHLKKDDVVIAISSSGSSPNVINAVKLARDRGAKVIGVSGFDGGQLNKLADAKLFVSTAKGEYEIVESVHSAILHLLTRYFRDHFHRLSK